MFDDTLPSDPENTDSRSHALQRSRGIAACSFKLRDDQTVLDGLRQSGCFKVRLPKGPKGSTPEAVLLNTAGGLADGDRLDFEGRVASGCRAIFTTQAAERVYRARDAVPAKVKTVLSAAGSGQLFWMPQETIFFDGGRLDRSLDIDLAKETELVAIESLVFGRRAMGETLNDGYLRDQWRVWQAGRLVHAEAFRLADAVRDCLHAPALVGEQVAMASILYIGADTENYRDAIRNLGLAGDVAASAWNGKLSIRAVATSAQALRLLTIPILTTLLKGNALPRVWSL